MSLRHAGLLLVGALFLLGAILLLAEGDTTTGVMSGLFALVLIVVPVAELAPDGAGARLEDGALVIGVSRTRRVLLLVGSVLFTAVGALLALASEGAFARLAGVLCVLVFGTFAVVGLWQMRGPWQLVMTPQALRWDQGGAGAPVGWDDIARVGMVGMSGAYSMAISLERPRGGLLARVNRGLGGGDVNVPLNVMSVDRELLLSIVTVCARDPRAREAIATEATLRRLTGVAGSRRGGRRPRGGPRPRRRGAR